MYFIDILQHLQWYNIVKKEFFEDDFNISFIKHLQSDIKNYKKWKTDINNIIFCLDCARTKFEE